MSTATIRHVIEEPKESRAQLEVVASGPKPRREAGLGISEAVNSVTDEYPLLMVFLAGAIAAAAAVTFIGSVVAWLALRHYGVLVF
ncbi:MAG: hypothetical protein LAP21_22545 [Acidobacteriia bacterium]|nr:hypothetical protein [Terriglobia bacterium]